MPYIIKTIDNDVRKWSITSQTNNNNNNNQRQCLWCYRHDHGHCASSPSSFDECRLSAGWPPTLRPSQPTWAVSPPINGCYHPHPPSPFLLLLSPKADTHFTVPRTVEGWVNLGTAGRVCSPWPRLYSGCRDNWPRPLTPQSIMPSLSQVSTNSINNVTK